MDDIQTYQSSSLSVPDYLRGQHLTTLRYDFTPTVTKQDLDNGSITRYFARQANLLASGEIIEINKSKFDKIHTISLYQAISITWRISGRLDDVAGMSPSGPQKLHTGVITANKLAIADAETQMPGMKLKLTNLAQFYKG